MVGFLGFFFFFTDLRKRGNNKSLIFIIYHEGYILPRFNFIFISTSVKPGI